MNKNYRSVGQKWLSLVAMAVLAVFIGSTAVNAKAHHVPGHAVKFTKATKSKAKKGIYAKSNSAKKYKKKKVSKTYKSKKKYRKSARKSGKKYSKKKYARKSKKSKRRYASKSKRRSKRVRSAKRGSLMATLAAVKPKGLPLRLAAAVVTVESGWRVNARGSSGERGLMQLMPGTARQMGVRGNLYNPRVNMRAGTKYLNYCYRRARGNVAATIGCYNRGPGRMWAWNKNRITRRYVAKVRRYMGRG